MGVRQLTMNPGKFDSLVAVLVDDLIPFLDKADQCEEIFNLLLQQVGIINLIIVCFMKKCNQC